MAAYAGTTTVLFSISLGSRRVNLLKVEITNYNHTTGIPLHPQAAGLGVIELVCGFLHGVLGLADSPVHIVYDPTSQAVYCFKTPDTPLPDDVNILTNNGPIMLLVIGA